VGSYHKFVIAANVYIVFAISFSVEEDIADGGTDNVKHALLRLFRDFHNKYGSIPKFTTSSTLTTAPAPATRSSATRGKSQKTINVEPNA
jgi:hypothetical protein